MDDILEKERGKYEKMWSDIGYERTNEPSIFLILFYAYFHKQIKAGQTVSDLGCGQGLSLYSFLQNGLKVQLVDITSHALSDSVKNAVALHPDISFFEQSLWSLNEEVLPTDWIFCSDVLEHIPTDKLDLVLKNIADRMIRGALFVICLREDYYGKVISDVLHLTVRPAKWWLEKVAKYFSVKSFEYLDDSVIAIRCN